MRYKNHLEKLSPEELAACFVFPVKLTARQQKAADQALTKARGKAKEKMTDEEVQFGRLMGLKYRMEDYVRAEKPVKAYCFGYFLQLYIDLLNMTQRAFAGQLGISETLLSQLINRLRTPPDYILIRLELHTNDFLPAEDWLRVVEKDRQRDMLSIKTAMREKERKHVTSIISARL